MKPKFITIDIESTGLNYVKDKITYIGFRIDGKGPVIDASECMSDFVAYLADPDIKKLGHNVKFDCVAMNLGGLDIQGVFEDTRLMGYLQNPFDGLSLENQAQVWLNRKHITFKDIYVKKKDKDPKKSYVQVGNKFVEMDDLVRKNTEDIVLCDQLRSTLYETKWYIEVERPLIKTIYDMERTGIRIDTDYLKQLDCKYESTLDLGAMVIGVANPNSSQQIGDKLGSKLLRKYSKKGKNGHYSTDKSVLKHMLWDGHKQVKPILEYRKLYKLRSTYIKPLLRDIDNGNRIHGSFNQAGRGSLDADIFGTATGRLSSSGPNLQNIPARTKEGKKIRRAFIPSDGMMMFDTDLKQIEPRVLAHYTQAPKLIKAYQEGLDTHGLFASDIFGKPIDKLTKIERFIGKTCWLATVYGCGARKLKYIVELTSEEPIIYNESFYKKVQDNFWAANPEILSWRERHLTRTRRSGVIETFGGRMITIPDINSRNRRERYAAERKAVNYIIQGSAADIMKKIMLRMDKHFRNLGDAKILAVIHDEILGEALIESKTEKGWTKKGLNDIINGVMIYTCKLDNVPIECDTYIIKNWGEAK